MTNRRGVEIESLASENRRAQVVAKEDQMLVPEARNHRPFDELHMEEKPCASLRAKCPIKVSQKL